MKYLTPFRAPKRGRSTLVIPGSRLGIRTQPELNNVTGGIFQKENEAWSKALREIANAMGGLKWRVIFTTNAASISATFLDS
jgi:hypothetical protein